MKFNKSASKFQIPPYLVYYWRNTGLLSPRAKAGELSFTDLLRARFICLCRKQGLSLQALRQAVADKADWEAKLTLYQDQILVQREESKLLLPANRQLLLNFEKKSKNPTLSFAKKKEKRERENALPVLLQKLEESYQAALEQKDSKKVERVLKKIVTLDPKHLSAWIETGNFYFNREEISKARQAYERSLEIDPSCIESLYNLANLHFKEKRYAASIRYFQKCLESKPDFIEAYYNFGLVLYHLGQRQEAAELLEFYLSNDPESFWAEQARQLLENMRSEPKQGPQTSNELRLCKR